MEWGGVAQRDCNFTDSAATGQRNCLGSFGSMIWLMSMNLKMQWAVYEWCCLYLFCRLIQATAATYLLQSLGKSLNSVILLLHSKKNDWGNSCTHIQNRTKRNEKNLAVIKALRCHHFKQFIKKIFNSWHFCISERLVHLGCQCI